MAMQRKGNVKQNIVYVVYSGETECILYRRRRNNALNEPGDSAYSATALLMLCAQHTICISAARRI